MYEPPIQLNFGDVGAIEQMKSDVENAITCRVQMALSVDVDKDELIRALQYDRGQYEKGYEDGKRDAVKHGYWINDLGTCRCSECGNRDVYQSMHYDYCRNCGAKMIGEMEYKMLYHSAFPNGKEQKNGQD